MAASPENYVSLLELRERWLKRQQEAEERAPIDARSRSERCEGNVRERSTVGRKPESLSGKGREKEGHRAGDIADRRRSYYWGQNKDSGGGEGRGRRGIAVMVAEGSAQEQHCAGRSESELGSFDGTSKYCWKLPREKEIEESSCFASAVVEDSYAKGVNRGNRLQKCSDQRQRSFKRSDSGPGKGKEDDAGGNWNEPGGKDDGGCPRELVAFAEESGALERPTTRRSDPEVRLEAQKSTISPVDSGSILRSRIVEDSGGNEKSEVFHKERSKSKGKNKKDAGVVGAEESQGWGNWQRRPLKKNEDADIGDGRRQRDVVSSVEEIVALEQCSPRRLDFQVASVDGMPTTVCHEAFLKKSGKSRGKRRGKYKKNAGMVGLEEGQGGGNWQSRSLQRNEDAGISDGVSRRNVVGSVAAIVAQGRRLPRTSDSEVVSGDHMLTFVPDVLESPPREKELVRSVCFTGTVVKESSAQEEKRSNEERKEPDVVWGKDDEDRLDNMAEDMRDAPAEAMKEECRGIGMNTVEDLERSNNYQQKGFKKKKSGSARIRENEEQVGKLADGHNMPPGDFSGDKVAVKRELEPAKKNSRTEGQLGEKQKNVNSSKEMMFHRDEGEVMRRLRDFSVGSSRRRGAQERILPTRAESSRSWSIGNSGRKNGVLSSYMDRDMVWVKKGEVLSGNNRDDVAQDR